MSGQLFSSLNGLTLSTMKQNSKFDGYKMKNYRIKQRINKKTKSTYIRNNILLLIVKNN